MTQENQVNKIHLAILLGFLAALAPLATDMYLPALPTMNEEFDASTSIIQMTLTMTLVGMAIGQLFAGPISDRFGRKSPLVVGMVFFTLSTFGCIFSEDITHFLIFRFIQGLSGSFGIVIARAIARDTYKGAELTKCYPVRFDGQKIYGKIRTGGKNMQTQKRKTNIRYDETFKEGAIKMVREQKIAVPQSYKELGITDDTLRNWL